MNMEIEFDAPFFKVLSHNDSGESRGHQGGMVFPKGLRCFFPEISGETTVISPTIDRYIIAELWINSVRVDTRKVRYQMQTWGSTRLAESRITEGFAPLRKFSKAGDIVLFERDMSSLDKYKITLLSQDTSRYADVLHLTQSRTWGPLDINNPPMAQEELNVAFAEVKTASPLFEIQTNRKVTISNQMQIARSSIFRHLVRKEYNDTCCVSEICLHSVEGQPEIECAHIIPVCEGGPDDVRNGIALTRTLHWAFDKGMFGIMPDRKIHVPISVRKNPDNAYLSRFNGAPLREASTFAHRAHDDALKWHLAHVVAPHE